MSSNKRDVRHTTDTTQAQHAQTNNIVPTINGDLQIMKWIPLKRVRVVIIVSSHQRCTSHQNGRVHSLEEEANGHPSRQRKIM
jgi:uracil DNA glycosylase